MTTSPPEWIRDDDGSRVPFEPEGISRDLFAAMEAEGEPNSFLARELTDAVLFFLGQEGDPELERAALTDLVCKVVREMGYPELASGYEALQQIPDSDLQAEAIEIVDERTPFLDALQERESPLELNRIAARHLREGYSRSHVYPRDLLSAAEQGLIVLTDLESPLELASMQMHLTPESDLLDEILQASQIVSHRVLLFGVEKLPLSPSQVQKELKRASEITHLQIEVRLNHDDPPPAPTGLFALAPPGEPGPTNSRDWLTGLKSHSHLSIGWHLTPADFTPEMGEVFLTARDVELILARPRPVSKSDTVLTSVGMNLSDLLSQLGHEVELDVYLKKLGSLTRLAKSVGYVRRKYLRRHAREAALRGFRLERSRLRVTLNGLSDVARYLAGSAAGSPSKWVEMKAKLLSVIRESLESDRPGSLETSIETVQTFEHEPLTLAQQLRFGAQIQSASGGHGTLWLRPEAGQNWQPELVAETLKKAWDIGIGRLTLV